VGLRGGVAAARRPRVRPVRAHAAQPVDSELDDLGAANVILTNGARLYVDHAHPEFSTPEVTTPRDVVIWDKAGERVMEEAAMRAATVPGAPRIQLYKNNVDGKGASYGSHENYLMARQTTFPSIVAGLTPFFVTRQVVCGAGRVGRGASGDEAGYQISQRADYIEVEVGWRPPSSAASSTPATSRTPMPTSTAACTSSSATRT
jgi:proteasome accessory factor A